MWKNDVDKINSIFSNQLPRLLPCKGARLLVSYKPEGYCNYFSFDSGQNR
jgi:hypothetical protein